MNVVEKKNTGNYGVSKRNLVYKEKFRTIAIDIYGPFEFNNKKIYVLSMFDMASRWVEFGLCQTTTSKEMFQVLYIEWLRRYPLPTTIICDDGRSFISNEFKDECLKLNISVMTITPYNPTSNSICERLHGTLGNCLRLGKEKPIKIILCEAADLLRATFYSSLGTSPIELLFKIIKINLIKKTENEDYEVYHKVEKAAENNMKRNSNKLKSLDVEVGNKVFVYNSNRAGKLDSPYLGPFEVLEDSVGVLKDFNIYERVNKKRIKFLLDGANCHMVELTNEPN